MAQLFDGQGNLCGNIGDDQAVPTGYWTMSDGAPLQCDPLTFIDAVGVTSFAAIWQAMQANPQLAFSVMRGFAAQSIIMAESFPETLQMEQAGLLPAGAAIALWQAIAATAIAN